MESAQSLLHRLEPAFGGDVLRKLQLEPIAREQRRAIRSNVDGMNPSDILELPLMKWT